MEKRDHWFDWEKCVQMTMEKTGWPRAKAEEELAIAIEGGEIRSRSTQKPSDHQ